MKINKDLKVRNVVNEHVVLFPSKGNDKSTRILSLNSTSNFLWESLKDRDFTCEDVVELLCSNYEVEREVAQADAQKWIDQLSQLGVLE